MWPFKQKPAWAETYAQRLYDGLVARNDLGDINALSLRIPFALHRAYQDKILLQREMICFVALASAAHPGSRLQPVLLAFGDLLISKLADRGLQLNIDRFAEAAFADLDAMFNDPFPWAQRWLAEFRDDPKDTYMVAVFAEHCRRLFSAHEGAIKAGPI